MIVKCNNHGNAERLTEYLISQAENERIEIVANHGSVFTGLVPEDVHMTSRLMQMQFESTKGKYPCYHAQISPGKDEALTPEQIPHVIETYLSVRKMAGRPHIAAAHYKPDGSMHLHLQISRYDPKTGKLDKNKMWRDEHDAIRAKLEKDFGHARTPQRNVRRPQIRQEMTDLYQTAKKPKGFIEGVNKLGYILAYGGNKSHPWQLVDGKAVAHNMASLVHTDGKKVTNKALSEYFRGEKFPNLKQALTLQQAKVRDFALLEKKAEKEVQKAEQFKYSPDMREVAKTGPEKKQQSDREAQYRAMIEKLLERNRQR